LVWSRLRPALEMAEQDGIAPKHFLALLPLTLARVT
jgi:hypothetical protein